MKGKKYKVISNKRFGHCFEIGSIVTVVHEYSDTVLECQGEIFGEIAKQDVHLVDLKEISETGE